MTRPLRNDSISRSHRRTTYKADQLMRRPAPGTDATYEFAYGRDDDAFADGDTFTFPVPYDVAGLALYQAEAGVCVVGASTTEIQIKNLSTVVDMLTTTITIDSGEYGSPTAAVASVVDDANALVEWGDRIQGYVVSAGLGAAGLRVMLRFSVPLQSGGVIA
jgi:hypothetical protein